MKDITREKIIEHFRHDWYQYIIVAVAALAITSLVALVLADKVPDEKRIDIMMISSPCPSYAFGYISDLMLADEELEQYDEIQFYHMDKDNADRTMQLPQWLIAGEGDVFIMNEENFRYLVENGAIIPVDEYISNGSLVLPDGMQEECYSVDGKSYGLPISYLKGFENFYPIDMNQEPDAVAEDIKARDEELGSIYIGIASYSKNIDGAVRAVQWMMDHMQVRADQEEFNAQVNKYW